MSFFLYSTAETPYEEAALESSQEIRQRSEISEIEIPQESLSSFAAIGSGSFGEVQTNKPTNKQTTKQTKKTNKKETKISEIKIPQASRSSLPRLGLVRSERFQQTNQQTNKPTSKQQRKTNKKQKFRKYQKSHKSHYPVCCDWVWLVWG